MKYSSARAGRGGRIFHVTTRPAVLHSVASHSGDGVWIVYCLRYHGYSKIFNASGQYNLSITTQIQTVFMFPINEKYLIIYIQKSLVLAVKHT